MKKIAIMVAFLAFIIGGSSYYYIVGTPTYSLYKIKKAIQNHDSTEFNKYIDVERVVSSLIDDASKNMQEDDSLSEFSKNLAQTFLPALKETLRNSINKSIEEISNGESDKLSSVKIKDITKEGKSANVTIDNAQGEIIKLNMIQTTGRYWKIVRIDFNDFKKINPAVTESTDTAGGDQKTEVSKVIEKNIGDEVELATLKVKANSVEEIKTSNGSFGSPVKAKDGAKFVLVNFTLTNVTKDSFNFDTNDIKLTDNQDRKFDAYGDTIGNFDNYLDVRSLQPSLPETGIVPYEVPEDATSYSIDFGKKGTNEVYRIKLK